MSIKMLHTFIIELTASCTCLSVYFYIILKDYIWT